MAVSGSSTSPWRLRLAKTWVNLHGGSLFVVQVILVSLAMGLASPLVHWVRDCVQVVPLNNYTVLALNLTITLSVLLLETSGRERARAYLRRRQAEMQL